MREKKKLSLPFFIHFVFVACFDTLTFFVHSGFLRIKEKEGTFLYTRTRAQKKNVFSESFFKERERERKKKEHGEERGTTLCFVSIQQKRKSKEDFCFKRDDEERSFFFNLLVPGGTLVLRG